MSFVAAAEQALAPRPTRPTTMAPSPKAPVNPTPAERQIRPRRPARSAQQESMGPGDTPLPAHPMVQATVGKLHSIMTQSEQGDMTQLMDLYDDMRERDGWLDAVCRTRTLAVVSRTHTFLPPPGLEEDREAQRIAKSMSEIMGAIESWPTTLGQIVDGVLKPYSVHEMVWVRDRERRWIPQFIWRNPRRFGYNNESRLTLAQHLVGQTSTGQALEDRFGPDKFVIHAPTAGRAVAPQRRGVLRSAIFPALIKRYGMRFWLVASERFGQPAPVLKIQGNNTETIEDAQAALRELNSDWATVIDKEMELDQVPGTGNFSGEGHARLVEMINREHTVIVLGQNLTTDVKGGSFAAAQVHEQVKLDYLAADIQELEATVRRDVLEPIVRYNFGANAPVPVMQHTLVPSIARQPEEWHFIQGILTTDEVRSYLGYTPRNDGEAPMASPREPAPEDAAA